jgi:hypothetical protein
MTSKIPRRVADRPDPALWGENELMNLGEAAALLWPRGPISERTLRTAVRDGRLPISRLAGKFFVTKAALATLSKCEPIKTSAAAPPERAPPSAFENDLAAIRDMADRASRRRRKS